MTSHGEFAFGPAALVFRGDSAENRLHAHAAVQCVYSAQGVHLQDASGTEFHGPGWMICSGTTHRLAPVAGLVLLLVEPQSPLGQSLAARHPAEPIAPLDDAVAAIVARSPPIETLLTSLEIRVAARATTLDPRISKALDMLDVVQARDPATVAAERAGISPSRLRALCRQQLGVPFSKLVLWRKVRQACLAMGRGESLAQAAVAAGFADQAHLTRTMSDVIGLTPGEAARVSD